VLLQEKIYINPAATYEDQVGGERGGVRALPFGWWGGS
jgi:hypothetical protein